MNILLRNFILLAFMVAANGLAVAMRPTHKIANDGPRIDLETLVPRKFGDWRIDDIQNVAVVNPQQAEIIKKIYAQTLSRTYVNSSGHRVMLSIAYGGDQSDSMRAHRPEVCYAAQGFTASRLVKAAIPLPLGDIPVSRLVATQQYRIEPITYWLVVGDLVAGSSLEQKLSQLSYGVRGEIPDGVLLRVSSIDKDVDAAFDLQGGFIAALYGALPVDQQIRFFGRRKH